MTWSRAAIEASIEARRRHAAINVDGDVYRVTRKGLANALKKARRSLAPASKMVALSSPYKVRNRHTRELAAERIVARRLSSKKKK